VLRAVIWRLGWAGVVWGGIAHWRNRIETTIGEITTTMELARHGARTFWGLLTRTVATTAAYTLMRLYLINA
jgi:hypothetical protein